MSASSLTPYPSDLTDAQWELIAPMGAVRPGGRPPIHSRRRIVDAILYVNRTGCSWRQLPHDFPPWDTVYWYFKTWNEAGVTDRIHDALRAAVRDADGRDPMASAGIVDAQSIKGADTVGKDSRGYDAGKKVNGRKRHIVTDTLGLLVVVLVTAASVQDRDGGRGSAGPGTDRHALHHPDLGRRWLRGQARRLDQAVLPDAAADRAQARGTAHLRGPAPPLGGGANAVLAGALPPPRP